MLSKRKKKTKEEARAGMHRDEEKKFPAGDEFFPPVFSCGFCVVLGVYRGFAPENPFFCTNEFIVTRNIFFSRVETEPTNAVKKTGRKKSSRPKSGDGDDI